MAAFTGYRRPNPILSKRLSLLTPLSLTRRSAKDMGGIPCLQEIRQQCRQGVANQRPFRSLPRARWGARPRPRSQDRRAREDVREVRAGYDGTSSTTTVDVVDLLQLPSNNLLRSSLSFSRRRDPLGIRDDSFDLRSLEIARRKVRTRRAACIAAVFRQQKLTGL